MNFKDHPVNHDHKHSPQSEQAGENDGFLQSLRSSIQHFKKEGKGEFAAGILLAVNRYKEYAALWQAASQEKGVRVEIEEFIDDQLKQRDMDLKKSAFCFDNGIRIIIYTGLFDKGNQIRSYRCNENWEEENKPFAECPLSWSGKTATEYHLFLRNQLHKPQDFIPEQSSILSASPAPDTVQGQEELWGELWNAFSRGERIEWMKSKFTLTKNS